MSRSRSYKTEAVVLKQMSLGEADRILTLYTPDLGKVRAVAKGIRRPKSKLGGHLELLNQVSVSMAYGRDLDVVNEAQVISSYAGFKEDLQALSRALYISELVDGFSTERSANYAVYLLLVDTLGLVGETQSVDLLVRHFEMHILGHLGYRPELYQCVGCRSTLEPGDHLFNCAVGGVLCPECRVDYKEPLIPVSLNAMKVLRFLQREGDHANVAALKVSASLLSELERLLRACIRYIMERELKSAEFMNLVSSSS